MNTIKIKVGEFLQEHAENIIKMCNEDTEELLKLQDIEYTKTTFGIKANFSFLIKLSNLDKKRRIKYYKKDYSIGGETYGTVQKSVSIG